MAYRRSADIAAILMSPSFAFKPITASRRTPVSDSVILVTDVATSAGMSIARRLASEPAPLVIAGSDGAMVCLASAEVARVRELNRLDLEAKVHLVDTSTDVGARALLDSVVGDHARLDAIVIAVRPAPGPPSVGLTPLLAMLRRSLTVLGRQPAGRLLLVLDVSSAGDRPLPSAARARLDEAFESLVRATARTHFRAGLCINGLLIDPKEDRSDQALSLAGGAPSNGSTSSVPTGAGAYTAAAGVVAMLASHTGCGITGQVFRIGTAPPEPTSGSGMEALVAKSLPLP